MIEIRIMSKIGRELDDIKFRDSYEKELLSQTEEIKKVCKNIFTGLGNMKNTYCFNCRSISNSVHQGYCDTCRKNRIENVNKRREQQKRKSK